MRNLAGDPDADYYIEKELTRCGIEVVRSEELVPHSEVPTHLTGKLGIYTFTRAWYYWVVKGAVPLSLAEELYADPVGKTDIRVGGHCGCPSPHEYGLRYYDAQGNQVIKDPDGRQEREWNELKKRQPDWDWPEEHIWAADPLALEGVRAIVDTYHIDTELGLYIFARAIR